MPANNLPPALREALYAPLSEHDGTLYLPSPFNRADRARAMAAAIWWAYEKIGDPIDLIAYQKAIDALKREYQQDLAALE